MTYDHIATLNGLMDVWMVARSWNEKQQNVFNERLFIMLLLWSLVIQVTMLLN